MSESNYNFLIKRKTGNECMGQRWTLDNIKDGIYFFFELNHHYPTQKEFDEFDYLPSVRQIEKKYGGLVELRKSIGLSGQTDFSKGKHRSKVCKNMYERARGYEEEFYNFLISRIPEVRIHEHKVIRPGGISSDFFIYTNDKDGVVIDLFYAQDKQCLMQTVNYKQKKYSIVTYPVFFIVMNNNPVKQNEIELLINNKKNTLPKNIKVFTESYFIENFNKLLHSS